MVVTTALMDTLQSVHALGEHVLAAARYRSTGRIGLTVVVGGFATPAFGDDDTVVALQNGELTVTTKGQTRRAPVTTLRAAADFVGIEAGAPADVYRPATPLLLDESLSIDPNALALLVEWYTTAAEALRTLEQELVGEDPSGVTLWPEHFDVAIRVGDVNYGALGGDQQVPEPYAYVGPTGGAVPKEPSDFWNMPFGGARTRRQAPAVADVLAFYREGHSYL
jgi:hypothetical protein